MLFREARSANEIAFEGEPQGGEPQSNFSMNILNPCGKDKKILSYGKCYFSYHIIRGPSMITRSSLT